MRITICALVAKPRSLPVDPELLAQTNRELGELPPGTLDCHRLAAALAQCAPGCQHIVHEFKIGNLNKAAGLLATEARTTDYPELRRLFDCLSGHVRSLRASEMAFATAE